MLNPKLIEAYGGEDKCEFLKGLVEFIGEDLASQIRILRGREENFRGSIIPKYVIVDSSIKELVDSKIYEYISGLLGENATEEAGIFVFHDGQVDGEEVIDLWLI